MSIHDKVLFEQSHNTFILPLLFIHFFPNVGNMEIMADFCATWMQGRCTQRAEDIPPRFPTSENAKA